ncbi:Uncharacterised protein [Vibrio cholerae]|nr:Uncharacterised protein [Vibrio cholerae]
MASRVLRICSWLSKRVSLKVKYIILNAMVSKGTKERMYRRCRIVRLIVVAHFVSYYSLSR